VSSPVTFIPHPRLKSQEAVVADWIQRHRKQQPVNFSQEEAPALREPT
jgi:hypothetical protein